MIKKKNKNHCICIPLEIVDREINYKLLLAKDLAEKNYEVFLGLKSSINKFIIKNKHKNIILFDKGLTVTKKDYYKFLKRQGIKILVLDEEIINISPRISETILLSKFDRKVLAFVDHICLPKIELLTFFKNKKEYSKYINKFSVTGHPKFDLYLPENIQYLYKLSNYIKYNKYFLIICSFVHYNNIVSLESDIKLHKYYYKEKNDLLIKNYYEVYKYQERVFNEFEKLINLLNKKHPTKTIIIRPHPSERLDIYESRFNKLKNIKIIKDNPVEEWLLKAEQVIHHDSTTVLDLVYNNKKAISFLPFGEKDFLQSSAINSSNKAYNSNEVIRFINKAIIKSNNYSNSSSNKKILSIIDKLDEHTNQKNFFYMFVFLKYIYFYLLKSNLYSFYRMLFSQEARERYKIKFMGKLFTDNIIKKKLEIFQNKNLNIQIINSKLIKINKVND